MAFDCQEIKGLLTYLLACLLNPLLHYLVCGQCNVNDTDVCTHFSSLKTSEIQLKL